MQSTGIRIELRTVFMRRILPRNRRIFMLFFSKWKRLSTWKTWYTSSRVFRNTYSFRFDLGKGAWHRRYEPSDVVRSPMACEKEICPAFHIRARLWPHKKHTRVTESKPEIFSIEWKWNICPIHLCRSTESNRVHY